MLVKNSFDSPARNTDEQAAESSGAGRTGPMASSSPALSRTRKTALWLGLAAVALFALWHGWRQGVPVAIGEPGAERLECLSYAPFRRPGETPFDPGARVDEARLEADLRLLSARTGCVRTYSVSQGLDAVPRVAQRLGMTVLLGAWLGRDRRDNEVEIERAIGVAREHAGTVRAVVVGNEVLLRRELPEAELVRYIERVRRAVPVPVTYADVWEFWLKHPRVAPAVSFATIHILPYWEDDPIGIDAAVSHVLSIHDRMKQALPGLELLIGETGWPSEGRARREAVPGRVEQARFVRDFTREAAARGIRYNLIEGFDQPWKRHLEGAMGGAWGLLASDGRVKFEWHGPVAPREHWTAWRGTALAGAVLGAIGFAFAGRRRAPALHAAIGALAGTGLGALLAEQARYMAVWNRTPLEWAATGAGTTVVFAACTAAALLLARRLAGDGPIRLPAAGDAMRGWLDSGDEPALAGWVSLLLAGTLFAAAVTVVLHGFDARYRGFDWPLFAPAAMATVALRAAGVRRAAGALEERGLAAILLAGAAVMIATEGPRNTQALAYAALMAVLAAGGLDRRSTSSPSSAPTAAGS